MKKLFLLVPVAALALTACTSESTESVGATAQQPKEIAFMPLAQPATRAAGTAEYNAVEGVGYPQNYDMKVVAYSVPTTGSDGNYFGSATADGGILFKYNYQAGATGASHGYWGAQTTAQYWPLSPATLNFLAVSYNGSPSTNVVSPQFNANYASGVTVTLSDNKPASAASRTGQHDLMYAYGRAQVTQSDNALTIPGKVDMTFNHALAWVYFRVKAASAVEAAGGDGAITINSITLNGASYSGTFSAAVTNYDKAAGAGDLSWGTCQWSSPAASGNYASPNWPATALTTSFVGVGDGLLVVPQGSMATPAAAFTSFTIEYVLNNNTYTYTYTPTAAERQLLMGKKYIFDITFRLSEIFVNASVTDWELYDFDGSSEGQQNKDVVIP